MPRQIVIGDIHGCMKTLRILIEDRIQLTPEDHLYLLGDLIDRGPDSKGVLDYLLLLKKKNYQIQSIRGNHEEMMLQSLVDSRYMVPWIQNGAKATFRSFGIDYDPSFYKELTEMIPVRYLDLVNSFDYFLELEQCYIVHAGFNFMHKNPFQDTVSMVWSREPSYDMKLAKGKKIIHGHTPVSISNIRSSLGDKNQKIINIDAGCVYNSLPYLGNLAGLDLDSMELFIQKNIDLV